MTNTRQPMTEEMTKEKLTEAFRQAIEICMLFYQTHKSFKDNANELQSLQNKANNLKQILEIIWGSLCEIYAADNDNNEWTASSSHPGYLERNINNYKILVPYHLADYFPTQDKLDELMEIASKVKVSDDGVICISGSSTFLEVIECISDIDYCEYAPFDKSNNWQQEFVDILNTKITQENQDIILLEINRYCANRQRNPQVQDLSHAKLDFVTLFLERFIEVTNLVLPIDQNQQNDPTLDLSFAPQEVLIGDGSWIPQQLLNPLSLGSYATWLLDQVEKYAFYPKNRNMIKAAKRALSFCRITGRWEEGDKIIEQLKNSNYANQVIQEANSSLQETLKRSQNINNCNEEFTQRLKDFLNSSNPKTSTQQTSVDNVDKELKKIFKELLTKILKSSNY